MQFDQNKYISIHSEGNKKNNQQPINKYGMHVGGWGHKYYSSRSTDLGIKVRIKIEENF